MCQYAISISDSSNRCSLDFYGGFPSKGVCALCVKNGENNTAHKQQLDRNQQDQEVSSTVSVLEMAGTLSNSILRWASSGFQVVANDVLEDRKTICSACDLWDPTAFGGTGRCKKCGCSTQAKLRIATEKCPIGKW
jgi:hypothetical protein